MSNNEIDQDKDFKVLHEKYQAQSNELPPESLDVRILQAAHQAVDSHANDKESQFQSSATLTKVKKHEWYVPLSFVAILVLSLSVVLRLAFDPVIDETEISTNGYTEEVQVLESSEKSVLRLKQEQKASVEARQKQMKRLSTPPLSVKKQKISTPSVATSRSAPEAYSKQRRLDKEMKADTPQGVLTQGFISKPAVAPVMSAESADMALEEAGQNELAESENIQQVQIEGLLTLYKEKRFDELKIALAKYRETFPANSRNLELPEILRIWEAENATKSLQTD